MLTIVHIKYNNGTNNYNNSNNNNSNNGNDELQFILTIIFIISLLIYNCCVQIIHNKSHINTKLKTQLKLNV